LPAFAAAKGQEKGNVQPKPQGGHQAIRSTQGNFLSDMGLVHVSSSLSIACRSGSMRSCRMRENASRLTSEEHDMLALFHAAQAEANVVAGAARRWVVGQPLATGFKLVNVADGLRRAPSAQRILADAQQVGFGIA
jgi:hypothetical protein